jgi:hypothetical protein
MNDYIAGVKELGQITIPVRFPAELAAGTEITVEFPDGTRHRAVITKIQDGVATVELKRSS